MAIAETSDMLFSCEQKKEPRGYTRGFDKKSALALAWNAQRFFALLHARED
jgi:hypothetical protein